MISSYFVRTFYFFYFTIGILVSLGFSLVYLSAIVIIAHYFESKLYFAIRLALCGAGFVVITFDPFNNMLIQILGLKGSFLIKTAFALIGCVCGALMRPVCNEHINIKPQSFSCKYIELSLYSNWVFGIFAVSTFFVMHFIVIFDNPVNFFDFQTSNKGDGSTLRLAMGISSIFGLSLSLIAYLKDLKRIYLYASILTVCGLSTLFEPYFVHDYKCLFIYSIIMGFARGSIIFFKQIRDHKLKKFFFKKVYTFLLLMFYLWTFLE